VTEDEESAATWRTSDVVSQYPDCVDAMLKQAETGELFGFVDGQYIDVVGEISGQNFLAQGVQEMYVNGKSAEEAVAWTQQQMQDAIQ
jgi:multiple sugar transport system substrate-binding protein